MHSLLSNDNNPRLTLRNLQYLPAHLLHAHKPVGSQQCKGSSRLLTTDHWNFKCYTVSHYWRVPFFQRSTDCQAPGFWLWHKYRTPVPRTLFSGFVLRPAFLASVNLPAQPRLSKKRVYVHGNMSQKCAKPLVAAVELPVSDASRPQLRKKINSI